MAQRQAIVAGGCFWCTEAVMNDVIGVSEVESGYIGGDKPDPTYKEVCTGNTGHAEGVRVTFDDEQITLAQLYDVFMGTHDPTQLNRQGNDVGTQYRSAMFPADDQQRELFEAARDRAAEWWDGGIVTTIEPLGEFYPAEEYHQDFFAKNPTQGYCLAVAVPKVNKVRARFAEYVTA